MYYYVYIIQSKNYQDRYYVGYTTNIKKRIIKHNVGSVAYTSKYKLWKINVRYLLTISKKRFHLKNI